jgi:DNA modification methylase
MSKKHKMAVPTVWTPETVTEWVDAQLFLSKLQYESTGRPQPVSFRALCSHWPWAKRSDVFTHLTHRYPAKLLAYIPIFILSSSYAEPGDIILDPFAGTGTVLLESLTHTYFSRTCYGVEISPLARLIARTKTTPLNPELLSVEANTLYETIKQFKKIPVIPDFPNRDFWFRKKVQIDLAKAITCIEQMDASPAVRDFFRVCLSSIIRDVSWADPKVAPPVKLNSAKFPRQRRAAIERLLAKKSSANVLTYFRRAIEKNIARMSKLYSTACLLETPTSAEIIWDDARSIHKGRYIEKGKVDKKNPTPLDDQVGLVITSPPYINAQKYIRTTKFELWWLGLETETSILELDKQMIGTERIYFDEYKELIPVENKKADQLLKSIFKKSPERAAIVSRYFREMREIMATVHRLLKPGGYFVLVVGDNTVTDKIVHSHEILAEIAQEKGQFIFESILVDSIRSRGLITKRHETAGVIPEEWVLVLKKQAG